MLPNNIGFTYFVSGILAYIFGSLINTYLKIAPLVGMLLAGVLLRNTKAVQEIPPQISSKLEVIAIAVLLARTGLGISIPCIKKDAKAVLSLGILPCIVDACCGSLVAHFLFGMNVLWSVTLGLGLASTSPGVIVPLALQLKERGLGIDERVSSLCIGALPVDVLIGFVGNSVALGLLFTSKDEHMPAWIPAFVQFGVGVLGGVIMGAIVWYIGKKAGLNCKSRDCEINVMFFTLCLITIAIALFGKANGYSSAVAASTVMLWCSVNNFLDSRMVARVFSVRLKLIWDIIQPFFFSTIGNALDLRAIYPILFGKSLAILVSVETVRFLTTFATVHLIGSRSIKTAIFIAGKWCAKATVQAALANTALDRARMMLNKFHNATVQNAVQVAHAHDMYPTNRTSGENNFSDLKSVLDDVRMGHLILVVYLTAIMIAAPLSAVWVAVMSGRLLNKDSNFEEVVVDGTETPQAYDKIGAVKTMGGNLQPPTLVVADRLSVLERDVFNSPLQTLSIPRLKI
ncbi:Sodium/hydrogen exchanger 9B2 [Blyttiomyces sp. JEL0837]|nr:Sodium/hydrogen exchanger 9B2 [Blyttiomyces sp. JEL0837]